MRTQTIIHSEFNGTRYKTLTQEEIHQKEYDRKNSDVIIDNKNVEEKSKIISECFLPYKKRECRKSAFIGDIDITCDLLTLDEMRELRVNALCVKCQSSNKRYYIELPGLEEKQAYESIHMCLECFKIQYRKHYDIMFKEISI